MIPPTTTIGSPTNRTGGRRGRQPSGGRRVRRHRRAGGRAGTRTMRSPPLPRDTAPNALYVTRVLGLCSNASRPCVPVAVQDQQAEWDRRGQPAPAALTSECQMRSSSRSVSSSTGCRTRFGPEALGPGRAASRRSPRRRRCARRGRRSQPYSPRSRAAASTPVPPVSICVATHTATPTANATLAPAKTRLTPRRRRSRSDARRCLGEREGSQ